MKSRLFILLLVTPLFAIGGVISSGTATIPGTVSFDFDTGVVDNFVLDPAADVFWEQFTGTTRALQPMDGATIVNVGVLSFASVTLAELEALAYGTAGLDGSDVGGVLVPGDVFAIHTNDGNFSKASVITTGYNLTMQWETDSTVPEPGSFLLVFTGIAGFAPVRRARLKSSTPLKIFP